MTTFNMEHFDLISYFILNTGDSRVNMDPLTTTIYTMFLRSHNRIASYLMSKYNTWKDEKIFQRARQINVAIYKKIIYKEWIPALLGENALKSVNRISIDNNGQVSNEFATAGIRFYFSMMPGELQIKTNTPVLIGSNVITRIEDTLETMELKNEFYKPRDMNKNNGLETIMEAILKQSAMAMDAAYVDDVIFSNIQLLIFYL